MKINRFRATLIGLAFTIISILLSFTFVIPIISVIPGVVFELISIVMVDNNPYSNVGKLTVSILWFVFILTISMVLFFVYKKSKFGIVISNHFIFQTMMTMYFVVHSLGFYLYWANKLNYRSDGQLIFAAVDSFPISSLAFLPIGLAIDFTKNLFFQERSDVFSHNEKIS
jgi:hypothetical protein